MRPAYWPVVWSMFALLPLPWRAMRSSSLLPSSSLSLPL
jgi:hypothetical protein